MKLRLSALAVPLLLSACVEQSEPGATPAQGESAKAAAPAPAVATPAPAASPAGEGEKAAVPPSQLSAEEKLARATNPEFARGGAQRYEGGLDKLDSQYDLSKVAVEGGEAADDHDHDHGHSADDGHDHGGQDGSQLLPAAQAERYKGRIELAGGAPQTKDLGKLRQGDMGSFEFDFVSAGDEPLIITGVKPSCGCTKADILLVAEDGTRSPYTKGDPIPVGQKFVLDSEISTDGKPGGPFNATVAIYANDVRGVYTVRLTAEIEPVLVISPSQSVFFGRITTADRVEQTISVSTTRSEPFLLSLGMASVEEPVQLEYAAKNPDAEGKSNEWEVKVTLGPGAEAGMKNYPLHFRTDIPIAKPKYPSPDGSPQYHTFVLNVQAQVTGMVSAEPSFITFGMVRPGESVERKLRISCHDDFKLSADIPVTLEGLQGQEFPYADAFAVKVVPLEDGKEADLEVTLKGLPEALNGSFGGQMKVKVGHPHMDELLVRFSGVCRPGLPTQTPVQPGGQQPPQK